MHNEFEIKNYDTAENLTNQAKNNFLIYGNLDDADRFEYLNILRSGFECGIAYNYAGLKPEVLIVNNKKAFIGFSKTILCIDQETKKLISENKKGSLFYEFINVAAISLVVIIFELELMVMNYEGDIIWSIGFRDIIEVFAVEQNEIINIKCSDEDEFKFNLLTGQYIN